MNAAEPHLTGLEAETAYEVGMLLGAQFHHTGLLTEAEIGQFHTELKRVCAPLVGCLDPRADDWINKA